VPRSTRPHPSRRRRTWSPGGGKPRPTRASLFARRSATFSAAYGPVGRGTGRRGNHEWGVGRGPAGGHPVTFRTSCVPLMSNQTRLRLRYLIRKPMSGRHPPYADGTGGRRGLVPTYMIRPKATAYGLAARSRRPTAAERGSIWSARRLAGRNQGMCAQPMEMPHGS